VATRSPFALFLPSLVHPVSIGRSLTLPTIPLCIFLQGIQFISLGNGDDSSDEKTSERMLVSSNDSRIRIFRTSDKVIEVKFSGHVNKSSQIGASLGGDRKFLVCPFPHLRSELRDKRRAS
jgi:hypothetical protein